MSLFFNTAGPCHPAKHYMLPAERRLEGVRALIAKELYFVVHAPRQSGKTTCFRALAETLRTEGGCAAVHVSCESAESAGSDVERGVSAVLRSLEGESEVLPEGCRPAPVDEFQSIHPESRLERYLVEWCRRSRHGVVLFLDEIDALRDRTLIAVLRQLRSGYPRRPERFPQSVGLIGLRDVRDYRARVRPESETLGTSSPFNIKVESLTLRNFNAEEVAELYRQHTAATGQAFSPDAESLAFELTRGQPWLVNALAREVVEKLVPDRAERITGDHIELAKEALIERRDTHRDCLIDRLREPRVQRVMEPILGGELLAPDVLDDDVQFVKDLGLVASGPAGLQIANPIYREVIPRALTAVLQDSLPVRRAPYVAPDGTLLLARLLEDFRSFWGQHGEFLLKRQPYAEAAAQLILMAYLQRVVNGGGFIDREYAVGSGRVDLCVRWPHARGVQRFALELKVWRDDRPDPLAEGLEQLSVYLARLELDRGTLVIFDGRRDAPAPRERSSAEELTHSGRGIKVLRL